MKSLIQVLTLVGIFTLWGTARAYEVVIDIKVKQKSLLEKQTDGSFSVSKSDNDGEAWVEINGKRQSIGLENLNLNAPTSRKIDGEEWALEWLSESAPELIDLYGEGLDPDLMVSEIDLRKNKLRCRGREKVECNGELSLRLSVTRS